MDAARDPRDELAALEAEHEALEADRLALASSIESARAEVAERRRHLDALTKLNLPGASIFLQMGFAWQMLQWGQRAETGAFGFWMALGVAVLAVAGSLFMAARARRKERTLLAELAPPPTRVDPP